MANITFDGTAPDYTIGAAGGNALLLTSGGTIQIASTLTGSGVFERIIGPMVLEGNYTLANNDNTLSTHLGALGAISSGPVGTQTLTVTGVGITFTGAIGGGNGTIAVVKNGTGNLGLEGNSTFTGGLTINAGLVFLDNAGALNSAGINSVTFGAGSTGILALNDFDATISGLSSNGGSPVVEDAGPSSASPFTLTVNSTATQTFGGSIEDGGPASLSLVKSGVGTLILSGSNSYTGSTTINNSGTLQGGAANAFSPASAFNLDASGTLNLGGFSQSIGSLTGSGFVTTTGTTGSDTLTVGSDNTSTAFSGSITDATGGRLLALTKVGTGTLTLSGNNTSTGPINVIGGTLALGGGSLVANVTDAANFAYRAGAFNGRLIVTGGTLTINAPFTVGNGLENDGGLTIGPGPAITLSGTGLDNEGTLTMAGGTLNLSTSGGAANVNRGNFNLSATIPFSLAGATLTNNGTINLNGGFLSGGGMLINGAGGVVTGSGTISSGFNNTNGTLALAGGTTNISLAFANSGAIQLTAFNSALTGGSIANAGSIRGIGNIGNAITNTGNIEPFGGILFISGALSNSSTGLLRVSSGNQLIVTPGLPTNAGIINLTGGTFDNNNHPLNNTSTGQISGWGTFATGGTGLDNNGSITFSGGLTTVNGPLTNENGKTIVVAYNPAIFTGLVTNTGTGTFNVISTTVVFAGGSSGNVPGAFANAAGAAFGESGSGVIEVDGPPSLGNSSSIAVGPSSTLRFKATGGTAAIGTAVTATIASGGTLELAGTVSALSSGPNRVNITNNSSSPGILVSGTNQQVGNIDGGGTTQVNAGSDLAANHIVQSALIIGGTTANPGLVSIDASDASGNPLGQSSNAAFTASTINAATGAPDLANTTTLTSVGSNNPSPVPEPSTLALALLAILGVTNTLIVRHGKSSEARRRTRSKRDRHHLMVED